MENFGDAVSSVLTKVIVDLTAPAMKVQAVVYTPTSSTVQAMTTEILNSSSNSSNNRGTAGGTAGSGGLTTLEVAGIAFGIVIGLVSTLATAVMCLRGGGGLLRI